MSEIKDYYEKFEMYDLMLESQIKLDLQDVPPVERNRQTEVSKVLIKKFIDKTFKEAKSN
jgi:hypothetical protein